MNKILIIVLLLFISSPIIAQDVPLTIHPESKKIYRGDYPCKFYDLTQMMQPDKEASKYIKSAQNSIIFSTLFGIAGGGVFGYPIGAFLITGEMNWPVLSIGAGLIGISLALNQRFLQRTKRAVNIYNGNLNQTFKSHSELGLRFSPNGIGLVFSL